MIFGIYPLKWLLCLEVVKGLKEKKQAKMRQNLKESIHKTENLGLEMEKKARKVDTQVNLIFANTEVYLSLGSFK